MSSSSKRSTTPPRSSSPTDPEVSSEKTPLVREPNDDEKPAPEGSSEKPPHVLRQPPEGEDLSDEWRRIWHGRAVQNMIVESLKAEYNSYEALHWFRQPFGGHTKYALKDLETKLASLNWESTDAERAVVMKAVEAYLKEAERRNKEKSKRIKHLLSWMTEEGLRTDELMHPKYVPGTEENRAAECQIQ